VLTASARDDRTGIEDAMGTVSALPDNRTLLN